MKNMKIIYSVVVILFLVSSCNLSSNSKHSTANQVSYDTIGVKGIGEIKDKNDTCLSVSNRYHKRFGVIISNYYITRDSLALDLNNDSLIDTLVILSPLSLEPINFDCKIDSSPKRMLVEIINNNGRAKIRNIYTNLLSDVGGVLSHYNGMYITKGGFKIVHQAGARYSWSYSTEFSTADKNQLTLEKISKRCSFNGRDKSVDYYYNGLSLERINIIDTLKLQCNCDQLWKDLEKL
jgi:hypothetical protein